MNATVGHIGIGIGLVFSAAAALSLFGGVVLKRPRWVNRAPGFVYMAFLGVVVSVAAMQHALIIHDFGLAYVADNNSRETPLLYSITGMWAALQGSILLWTLILSTYVGVLAIWARKRLDDRLVAVALLVALVVSLFFFALMAGPADPFASVVGKVPIDGTGPNPLLQDNLLIAFHPVFLYLGYVGFTIPFSFAIAALITGRVGEGWLSETRRFTVMSWVFLTAGIILGAWWSYQELGWGGFWGWDPVENAALLPWLTGTAYLHSVMVQERRGLLRVWNLSLLIATFGLTILGTFLTRSGVTQSIHTFSNGSGVGPALLGFFGLVVLSGVGLIGWRGDRLRSAGSIDSPMSREGAFLVNNLLFAAFAFVVLLGTVFPLFLQAVDNQSVTIGRPFFDAFTAPIGIALLFFMAAAPALPWRKASSGVLRQRLIIPAWLGVAAIVICVAVGVRGFTPLLAFGLGAFAGGSALRQLALAAVATKRHGLGWWRGLIGRANGGMIVHLGIVVIAVGLTAASSFAQRSEVTLRPGATTYFDGHSFTFVGWKPVSTPNEVGEQAVVRVDGKGLFSPGLASFNASAQGTPIPAIDSSISDDVYLAIGQSPLSAGSRSPVSLDVIVQPLVMWLWVGGGLTVVGGILAALPGQRRRPTDPSSVAVPELFEDDRPVVGALT